MTEQRINLQGAVDLATLAATRKVQEQRQAKAEMQEGASGDEASQQNFPTVIDVTIETFEAEVLQESLIVPIILVFWTPRSEPSVELSSTLEKLAREDQGGWILGKVNADTAQQLITAFQVQTVPVAFAVIGGQPVPLFQGLVPEHKLREVIDAVLAQATQLGLPGRGTASAHNEIDEVPLDPRLERAQQAMDDGSWADAISAYQELLKENPQDSIARIGLLNVELFARVDGVDFETAIAGGDSSFESQLLAADCEFIMNDWDVAFARLVNLVKDTVGTNREQARDRLLQLFDIAGPHDASVIQARTALANALF